MQPLTLKQIDRFGTSLRLHFNQNINEDTAAELLHSWLRNQLSGQKMTLHQGADRLSLSFYLSGHSVLYWLHYEALTESTWLEPVDDTIIVLCKV
ncbi:hypothetical protein [Gayadomonas joobiniege]|uniref:hypothetical protein n=1 Tax=Gayadomonas joobiniege TaxID=1234606 RepID=UPI00036BF77F|nr:hypothetical protein [Gayadomonas joobiniege]